MAAYPVRDQMNREHRFPRPRLHLRIGSRETVVAVPFRVSLLNLHTQADSGSIPGRNTPLCCTLT